MWRVYWFSHNECPRVTAKETFQEAAQWASYVRTAFPENDLPHITKRCS